MKSHFTFTKKQRNGIFLLILLVAILQSFLFFVDLTTEPIVTDSKALRAFINEVDSLKKLQLKRQNPTIYPFNPNFITDFKGATLGMTNTQIDRLLAFRKKQQWIHSTKQFQEVTQISDSLLNQISPYFKFPKWVTTQNKKQTKSQYNAKKKEAEKQDLNTATASNLQQVNGIGKVLSERIIRFRNTFKGGFISDIQLQDIYGLTPEVIKKIKLEFTVKTPRQFNKINLNTATVDTLVTIQHIDYELAHHIIEQRTLIEGFKSTNDLTKVKGFPVNKLEIIELYLHIEKEN